MTILLTIFLVLLGCAVVIAGTTLAVWLLVYLFPMSDKVPPEINPTFDQNPPRPCSFIDYDEDC